MKYFLLMPTLIFFLLFTLWPIIKVIEMSFYQTNFIVTRFVGLQNYVDLFNNEAFIQSIKNSLLYITILPLLNVIVSVSITFLIADLSKKWQDISKILIYIPVLGGGIILAQVWRWVFAIDGLMNWILSLFHIAPVYWFGNSVTSIVVICVIVVIASFGGYIIMLLAALTSIDKSIYEAAKIDGASDFQIKIKIILPLIKSTIALIYLLSMIASLQIFEYIYALVPQQYAATITYNIYVTGFKNSKWGLASAQAVILMVITFILSYFQRKIGNESNK
jgi:ABC-type sugar transport system permease subunit